MPKGGDPVGRIIRRAAARTRAFSTAARAEIDRIRPPAGDAPPDSFTVAQYAEKYGLPERTALSRLCALVRAGRLQAGTKHVMDSSGRRRQVRGFLIPKGEPDVVHRRGRRDF